MPQGSLSFKYIEDKKSSGMTALAGLPTYLDFTYVINLLNSIKDNVNVRSGDQGWNDYQVILSLILLNLAGGESVSDLDILEGDIGFRKVLGRVEGYGLPRKEKREIEKRFRKGRNRIVPSASSVFRYLNFFHNEEEEENRIEKKAFIPEPNEYLIGLKKVNGDIISSVQNHSPETTATVDMDAVLTETNKEKALYCYKGYKSYQPINSYWFEQDLVLHSEFRDGNVPAGYEQLRFFKETLNFLPDGVDKVFLRSDTAAYQINLMKYCAEGKNERFGTIKFSISVVMSPAFKKAVNSVKEKDWKILYRKDKKGELKNTGQEWAEVSYSPAWIVKNGKGPVYRFIAIRELLKEPELPGMEKTQLELPFPVMDFNEKGRYKISGIVSNRLCDELKGEDLIWWHRKRAGKSEEVHSVMKEDLAGGKLPSGLFGVNAAWWSIMILALNINSAMKRLALGKEWISKRMKAIRFHFINLPGRITEHARDMFIRLARGHPSNDLIFQTRKNIYALSIT